MKEQHGVDVELVATLVVVLVVVIIVFVTSPIAVLLVLRHRRRGGWVQAKVMYATSQILFHACTRVFFTWLFPSDILANSRNNQGFDPEQASMSTEPPYHNLHYFEVPSIKRKRPVSLKEEVKGDESNELENDYESLEKSFCPRKGFSAPMPGSGKPSKPWMVELSGKIYSVVDWTKLEQRNIYQSLKKTESSHDS